MEIILKKPIKLNDQEIAKIDLNLENLSGNDIVDAEQEARFLGDTSLNPLLSSKGLACVAAKSSGIVADDILSMKAQDFMRITAEVKNFLLEWALVD